MAYPDVSTETDATKIDVTMTTTPAEEVELGRMSHPSQANAGRPRRRAQRNTRQPSQTVTRRPNWRGPTRWLSHPNRAARAGWTSAMQPWLHLPLRGRSHRGLRRLTKSRRGSRDDGERRRVVRPRTVLDWVAFVLLLVGAVAWAYFLTDVNILDQLLERIADPADDVAFALIGLAGVYALVRALVPGRRDE